MSDQLGVYKTGLLEGTNDSTDLESVGKLQAFKELPSAGSAIGWKKRRGKHKNPASISPPLLLLIQCVTWRILLRESDVRVKFARESSRKYGGHALAM